MQRNCVGEVATDTIKENFEIAVIGCSCCRELSLDCSEIDDVGQAMLLEWPYVFT